MKEGDSWPPQSPQSRAPGCFNAHMCSVGRRALTCAVLVPGVAADGLHQEAVVGHGSSAPVPKRGKSQVSPVPDADQTPADLIGGQRESPCLPTLAWCLASL